jgi:glucose-1-phosphate thymidylyltransferase
MKAVILAAGKGTRMRGLCAETPKPMMPIANRPILSLIFSRLRDMGVDEVALVIGFRGEKLKELVGDGSQYGVSVTYVWQKEQLGTGQATLLCREAVGDDDFVLIFGDILTQGDNYAEMATLFNSTACDAVLTVFPVEDPSNGAAVDVKDGLVAGIIEKPKPGTILNAYNNAGLFIWPASMFELISNLELSPRGEYEFTDGIVTFIKQGQRLGAYELKGYWENISDPEACIRMNQNILTEVLPPEKQATDRSAKIGDSVRLAQCHISAAVEIGDSCRIEDSVLGHACRIGRDVSIKYAEIGVTAQIGEGCRIGPYVSIGEGAVIEPGATVGPNVSIGAGCVVAKGASLASSIILDGGQVGAGASVVHAMLIFDGAIPDGEKIAGTPNKAIELLT